MLATLYVVSGTDEHGNRCFITRSNHEPMVVEIMESYEVMQCICSSRENAQEIIDYIEASASGETRSITWWIKKYKELVAMGLTVDEITVT